MPNTDCGMKPHERIVWVLVLVLLGSWVCAQGAIAAKESGESKEAQEAQAQRQRDEEATWREMESYRLLEIMRNAQAPPMPPSPIYWEKESASPEHRSVVSYDLATGEVSVSAAGPILDGGSMSVPSSDPLPLFDESNQTFMIPWSDDTIEGLDEPDSPIGSCTPPSPNLATHSYPWSTTYKLLMRFESGGLDYYYVCSASSLSSFHLLTAGHCIYNHDPNGDENTADAAWASEVWAWAAQTDYVNPFMSSHQTPEDRPFSFAKSTLLRTYTGWTNSSDLNHDMGYVTLDRRDGNHTGWMGREFGVTTTTMNFNGYPAETPYVPAGEIRQYPGFDSGNVNSYTTYRINMCAYVYGGHSGGPDWRYDGTNRYVQGVNSTSNRVGSATATRLTSGKFTDISNMIADDEGTRPPVARPDLAEYFFTTVDDRKDLLVNSVPQGVGFNVEYNVLNAGFASSGTITVDFYLSSNNLISSNDNLIGTRALSSHAAWSFSNLTTTLTTNITPGTYYLGWIMSSSTAEYGGDLVCTNDPCTNVAVIADETLTVTAGCSADAYEPDNSSGQASGITGGALQTHSICPIGDEDWVFFNLSTPSGIDLWTSGPSGDTRLFLYNSAVGQIDFDDDGGTGLFSRIQRTCGVDQLPAGLYYAHVDEFGNNDFLDPYQLALDITPCAGGSTIFADGFESGNTSAWSSTVP